MHSKSCKTVIFYVKKRQIQGASGGPQTPSCKVSPPTRNYTLPSLLSGEEEHQEGVPIEMIKLLDDWKSNAVLMYLTVPVNLRINSANQVAKHILQYRFIYLT